MRFSTIGLHFCIPEMTRGWDILHLLRNVNRKSCVLTDRPTKLSTDPCKVLLFLCYFSSLPFW